MLSSSKYSNSISPACYIGANIPAVLADRRRYLFWSSNSFVDMDSIAPIVSALEDTEEPNSASERLTADWKHRLVVHFDINETILVGDDAGGDTREDCIHKIIAKSAYVKIPFGYAGGSYEDNSNLEPTEWWNGLLIREEYDEKLALNRVPPLYTGWQWPPGCCPYYRTAFKNRAKTFVNHHGSLYKSTYLRVEELLPIPDSKPGNAFAVFAHMLPAFFETVVKLSSRSQPYTLVFRTMGSDLEKIATAFNAFASGKHPNYPNFQREDLIISQHDLVEGRWSKEVDLDGNHVFQLWRAGEMIASGDAQVLDFLDSRSVCGIQDDYEFWKVHRHQPWAGKPVWIPRSKEVQHILLDDNIHNLSHDSIASTRVEREDGSFRTLSDEEIRDQQGIHLVRVPTVAPILQPTWFLEQIDSAQRRFVSE